MARSGMRERLPRISLRSIRATKLEETLMSRLTRRKFLATTAAAGGGLASFGILTSRARAAEFTYKYANNVPVTHPMNVRSREAVDKIKEESGGRLEIQIFPNNQLGGDTDMLSQVRSGAIEFFTLSGLILSTLVPVASINGIGFAFKNYDQVWPAMDGSLGASPASINFSEVYSALQTKVVEGQENPLSVIDIAKLYEVQKYCSITNHMWDGFWFLANTAAYKKLPNDLQEIVAKNLNAAALKNRDDIRKLNESLQGQLTQKGMAFNNTDAELFRAALRKAGFYDEWKQKFGAA